MSMCVCTLVGLEPPGRCGLFLFQCGLGFGFLERQTTRVSIRAGIDRLEVRDRHDIAIACARVRVHMCAGMCMFSAA